MKKKIFTLGIITGLIFCFDLIAQENPFDITEKSVTSIFDYMASILHWAAILFIVFVISKMLFKKKATMADIVSIIMVSLGIVLLPVVSSGFMVLGAIIQY